MKSASPFDYPEIRELFKQLLEKLFDESERGAIIIATSHIEDHFTEYIKSILPNQTNKYKNKLFQYPGSLSSFSAKIELAYAFGLIDLNLFNRLNSLRKIRNEASHKASTFSLIDLKDKMREVYNLGPSASDHIKRTAVDLMIRIKSDRVKVILAEHNLTYEEKKEIYSNIMEDKETIEILTKQIPQWELLYGVCLICGLISFQRDSYQIKNQRKLTK